MTISNTRSDLKGGKTPANMLLHWPTVGGLCNYTCACMHMCTHVSMVGSFVPLGTQLTLMEGQNDSLEVFLPGRALGTFP